MTDIKYLGVQGLEELITITKNNLAKKADTLQFDVMPDPVKYTGKVVQYVGVSDVSYTRSHFYYSDGTRWTEETISDVQTTQIKFVNVLPDWISADPQVLYVLKGTENKLLSLYVKNTAVNDSWYTVSATQEIDIALSSTSTNPVQNKVVHAAIQEVRDQVTSVYHYKGSCLTAALPSEGNVVGDTWNLEDASSYGPAGVNVAWTGTEWDALSGDINYMRGLHDPDWSHAVSVTVGQLVAGYTAPGRGIVVGYATTPSDGYTLPITVNGVTVGASSCHTGYLSIQVPVNKNDVIKALRGDNVASDYFNMSFVPYKVQ